MISTDNRQSVGQLEQPTDESSLCKSFELNSRTFTRTSTRRRRSQLAADDVELRSNSNSSAAGDADERVRCNGGESMVDCAADVRWTCDEPVKDNSSCICDDHLPDMVDIQIVAKAKLQERGQYHLLNSYEMQCHNVANLSYFLSASLYFSKRGAY